MIRILTDSVSNIPKELLQQYNIKVLPLRVHFGEAETYLDFDFEHDQIFKMIEEKPIFPNTTAPTINDFDQAFAELTQETDQILGGLFFLGHEQYISGSSACRQKITRIRRTSA